LVTGAREVGYGVNAAPKVVLLGCLGGLFGGFDGDAEPEGFDLVGQASEAPNQGA
jgi:hypothetical protein